MTALVASEFGSYFKALHGYDPFPWQRRLASIVLERDSWPDVLDIPTGLGKTSSIDIALFVLAFRPETAPRRILLIVDRRVVVDQAADHARKIQKQLTRARDGVLNTVANALRQLWRGAAKAPPFEVAVLRGGMPRDEGWVHRPDRPVVALSTVDQVGSRLLFRGYGVSAGMAPIHAGLLGNDALLLLDEVQLSTAFAETLGALKGRWRPWRERGGGTGSIAQPIPDRWGFVRMSATPVEAQVEGEVRLQLTDEDYAHPVVQKRIQATKLAELGQPIVTSRSDAEKSAGAVVEAFAKQALEHIKAGATRLAIIVNRVATARQVHEHLKLQLRNRAEVVLLTGRMRAIDREDILGKADDPRSLAGRILAGAERVAEGAGPVVVVSTQTIEAGADFDFDALVTECASIDALRQRFGRLDRRGELGRTRATILIRKDQVADSADDPVYGIALSRTWNWLERNADEERTVDFGIAHFPGLPTEHDERAVLCSPIQRAPVLLPAHLDAWAQTNPRGEPDPDVALWLHGPQHGVPEVRVVWRADIDATSLSEPTMERSIEAYASASLAVAPPSSLESLSVPLHAFRAWIGQQTETEIPDVEGARTDESRSRGEHEDPAHDVRAFLTVTKAGAKVRRDPKDLFPEATVVVPASYGGIRDGNWNPDAADPVRDVGDLAQLVHRARPVLRLVPEVLCPRLVTRSPGAEINAGRTDAEEPALALNGLELPSSVAQAVPRLPEVDDPGLNPRSMVQEWLAKNREAGTDTWQLLCDLLGQQKKKLRIVELGRAGLLAAIGPRLSRDQLSARIGKGESTSDIVNDDDDSASYIGQEVTLERHLDDVERWARMFAENLGLSDNLSGDLALAAVLHDIGKADPRFQQMLHGGSAVRMAASQNLLAKSRGEARDRKARDEARRRADYPSGYRHELLSVAMLQGNEEALGKASDPELVLHLVGSHHGWCRPFAPAIDPGPSRLVELALASHRYAADTAHGLSLPDSGVADRYWTLTERYGWWNLAWFETLVRLADHRASEESARGPSAPKKRNGAHDA